jgi:hypothetical protein
MMFSTRRPAAVFVYSDSATLTNATPRRVKRSSSGARSFTLRVSRSNCLSAEQIENFVRRYPFPDGTAGDTAQLIDKLRSVPVLRSLAANPQILDLLCLLSQKDSLWILTCMYSYLELRNWDGLVLRGSSSLLMAGIQ